MKKIIPKAHSLIPDNAKRVFKGEIFEVHQWQQELFDGSFATFEQLKRPDTVVAILYDGHDFVVVADEQPDRPPILKPPGGRAEPDDRDWLETAQREVREETGMVFDTWRLVSVRQPDYKNEWFIVVYLATELISESDAATDKGEKISIRKVGVTELLPALTGYAPDIAKQAETAEDVIHWPSFRGVEVDRY